MVTDALTIASRAYLVEHFGAITSETSATALAERLARAAHDRSRGVQLIGSACVPGDECFLSLFGATSMDAVGDAVARAGVVPDRIVPVLWLGRGAKRR